MIGATESGSAVPDQNISLRDCVIGYVDILGTKDILCSENDESICNFISNVKEMYDTLSDEHVNIRIFSDNILFFNDYTEENLDSVLNIVSKTQYYFIIKYGLLVRGAIVRGNLYFNDTFVLGSGLVRAYLSEEKKAKNPRVIISSTIPHNNPRIVEYKGDRILNYLYESYDDINMCPNSDNINSHKKQLCKLYQTCDCDEYSEKQLWSIGYHNWFCEEEMIDEDYKIILPQKNGGVEFDDI